jgi:hypothetical protein
MQQNQWDRGLIHFLTKGSESKNYLSDAIFSTQRVKNMATLDNCMPGPAPCVFAVPIVALLHAVCIQTL